jgi:3-methyladenine DNA glycosylase AlkD
MTTEQQNILDEVENRLRDLSSNPENLKDYSRFVKEKKKSLILAMPLIRELAKEKYQEVQKLKRDQIWEMCHRLLKTGGKSQMHIAFDWAYRIKKAYEPADFTTFESWISEYMNDWSSCDDLCTHALGYHLWKFPENKGQLYWWTDSENVWFRRAAAVSLIYSARKTPNLHLIFDIAERLLEDKEDLVQKGYGWLLKVTSQKQQEEVFDFVLKNKSKMPRTALRYAIEKMPQELKTQAMKK